MSQEQNHTARIAPDACTISETQIIRLSVAYQHAFAEAMINPPAAGPALLRAADAHRGLIQGSKRGLGNRRPAT